MVKKRSKVAVGMFWSFLEKASVQLATFILGIVLARLLTPHDYGIIGMLTIFLTISQVFIDSGFSKALVQKQARTETDYTTVLIFNIAISLILYGILFFCSPLIAKFYEVPELNKITKVFFLVLITNSLIVVQNAQFTIRLDFKKIAIINLSATLISGGLGIFCAYQGLGVWSLVVQSLSRSLVTALLYWFLGRWFPCAHFSWKSFKELFHFGWKLLASGLLGTTLNNINSLVIGKLYSASSLGYYTRARQFSEMTAGSIGQVVQTVSFPVLAELQDKKEDLVKLYSRLLKLTAMLCIPAMVGLALLAEPIIILLLTEKWAASAPLLFWLALGWMFFPISSLNMNILNAMGRSDLFLKLDLTKIPLDILIMVITFPISIKAIAIGYFVGTFICYFINAYLPGKYFGYGAWQQIKDAWKIILSTCLMAAYVLLIKYFALSNLLTVIIGILGGIIIYALALLALREHEFINVFKILKSKKS